MEFGTVTIVTQSVGSIPGVLLTDLFHVTASCYTRNNAGAYVEISYQTGSPEKTYNKNVFVDYASLPRYTTSELSEAAVDGDYVGVNGRAYRYSDLASREKYVRADYEIDSDGILTDGTAPINFVEGSYALSFTFTFLPDEAYRTWVAATAPEPTKQLSEIIGYERVANGTYIGVIDYTPYSAKYHYGLTRYVRTGTEGAYTYTEDAEGDFVRVETSHVLKSDVTKYTNAAGAGAGSADGRYIKVGNEYLPYFTYNPINGFPYSNDRYRGARYEFAVNCSVEEV